MLHKHRPAPGSFRLIRSLDIDHNARRLKTHMAKVRQRLRRSRFMQIIHLKKAVRRAVAAGKVEL